MRNIILICGKAGAGKDTVASIISQMCICQTSAFALKVKALAKDMGWDGIKDTKGRKLLQDIGTAGRTYNDNIWINDVISRIHFSSCRTFVITDWRYKNEFVELQKEFQRVITIRVEGRAEDLGTNSLHHSEHDLDGYKTKYVIINDGSIDKLTQQVTNILKMEGLI